MSESDSRELEKHWFVLRDLKRHNAKRPAFRQLAEMGFQVFTPMKYQIVTRGTKRIKENVPVVRDLLFVYSVKGQLDEVVSHTETLQYRFVKGAAYCTPMTVAAKDMNRFMIAVGSVDMPRYYSPEEITPQMYGSNIRMICEGPMNGVEGVLLKIKGSVKKRLLVELPGLLAAAIEIDAADYVEII